MMSFTVARARLRRIIDAGARDMAFDAFINLTRSEWTQLVGGEVPYHQTCQQWPAGT